MKILIADDHPVVRQGLRQMLAGVPDISIAAEAASGGEVLSILGGTTVDLVLLDLSLPDVGGLDLVTDIVTRFPNVPVLILTIHAEDEFAVRALRAGARGYLTKDSAPLEMLRAIRMVAEGKHYVSPWLTERLASGLGGADRLPHERLSDREYQVFRLIASGKRSRDIAKSLSLSIKTVATYRARIFEKMGLHTSTDLAAYAVRHGLTE